MELKKAKWALNNLLYCCNSFKIPPKTSFVELNLVGSKSSYQDPKPNETSNQFRTLILAIRNGWLDLSMGPALPNAKCGPQRVDAYHLGWLIGKNLAWKGVGSGRPLHPKPLSQMIQKSLVACLVALDVSLATHSWCIHKVLRESFSIVMQSGRGIVDFLEQYMSEGFKCTCIKTPQ